VEKFPANERHLEPDRACAREDIWRAWSFRSCVTSLSRSIVGPRNLHAWLLPEGRSADTNELNQIDAVLHRLIASVVSDDIQSNREAAQVEHVLVCPLVVSFIVNAW